MIRLRVNAGHSGLLRQAGEDMQTHNTRSRGDSYGTTRAAGGERAQQPAERLTGSGQAVFLSIGTRGRKRLSLLRRSTPASSGGDKGVQGRKCRVAHIGHPTKPAGNARAGRAATSLPAPIPGCLTATS